MDQSYHDGAWPDRAPATLIYSKPTKLNDNLAAATIILHESIDQHPDGVWIGYADGHLQFASSPAEFAQCQSQIELLQHPQLSIANDPLPCKVTGDVTSLGLFNAGQQLTRVHAYAFQLGGTHAHYATSDINAPRFEFDLPPGDYGIAADGSDCDYATTYIHIPPGQRQRTIHLDIPAYAFTALIGKPALELHGIKAWKNGGPTTLASLRGKVVLLDFWGYWCPDCIVAMPALMKLHDDFSARGLVIVAVHDDSVDSIQDMDQKLTPARIKYWAGRDLPFLIALDGGGDIRITRSPLTVRGLTTASYGILKYPTSLLIGRDGIVVKRIDVDSPQAPAEIEKLLSVP